MRVLRDLVANEASTQLADALRRQEMTKMTHNKVGDKDDLVRTG